MLIFGLRIEMEQEKVFHLHSEKTIFCIGESDEQNCSLLSIKQVTKIATLNNYMDQSQTTCVVYLRCEKC